MKQLLSELILTFLPLLAAIISLTVSESPPETITNQSESELISNGKKVYIAEGCIHCHSQFIRPNKLDIEMWGPHQDHEEILKQSPVLIGNRRQGPDLLNVGNRRSKEWNKLHLIDPQLLSPGSSMPSYAYLFSNDYKRGIALIAYLDSLGNSSKDEYINSYNSWKPSIANHDINLKNGIKLYERNCSQCHGKTGQGDGPVSSLLSRTPRNFLDEKMYFIPEIWSTTDKKIQMMRIIKYGIPGTNMPGHEYLSDSDILDLTSYIESLINK